MDNLLSSASGVLCVLSLPERVMSHDLDMSFGALNDPEKYAIRAAVQVRPVHLLPRLLRTALTSASEAAQPPTPVWSLCYLASYKSIRCNMNVAQRRSRYTMV